MYLKREDLILYAIYFYATSRSLHTVAAFTLLAAIKTKLSYRKDMITFQSFTFPLTKTDNEKVTLTSSNS